MRRDRREVLERLDRLLAPLRVPRPQGGREDLLQQGRLAIGRSAEDAQVAPPYAEALELGYGTNDLPLGVVVEDLAVAALALDHAVLLELLDERPVRPGVIEHVLEAVEGARPLDGDAGPAHAAGVRRGGLVRGHLGVGPARRQLLADHPQREELVALEAEDRL